jgi:hypothetical protein
VSSKSCLKAKNDRTLIDRGPSCEAIAGTATGKQYGPQTRAQLEASLTTTLLQGAVPNVLLMLARALIGFIAADHVGGSWFGGRAPYRRRAEALPAGSPKRPNPVGFQLRAKEMSHEHR